MNNLYLTDVSNETIYSCVMSLYCQLASHVGKCGFFLFFFDLEFAFILLISDSDI